jgi:prephenate dehydratase
MRIAYLGPEGTFSHEALTAAGGGAHELVPLPTLHDTIMAVHDGSVDRAFVPIENSLEGSVTATLDALAGEADRVRIAAEVVRPIAHCLAARAGLALDDVRRVISHPQALAQCAGFLRGRLPRAETATAPSTADAVRTAATTSEPWAALGPRLAAELYGCEVLAENVEDRSDNSTRFVWLAPEGTEPQAPPTKTSIVFWGFNDESPGALVGVLGELAARGVNLTKIESRPRRVRLGHYMFFADLEGAADDPRVTEALDALSERVQSLKVLGSYPVLAGGAPR